MRGCRGCKHIFATIEQWTMTKTKFEAMDILNKLDIPCGPILSMKEHCPRAVAARHRHRGRSRSSHAWDVSHRGQPDQIVGLDRRRAPLAAPWRTHRRSATRGVAVIRTRRSARSRRPARSARRRRKPKRRSQRIVVPAKCRGPSSSPAIRIGDAGRCPPMRGAMSGRIRVLRCVLSFTASRRSARRCSKR